MCLCSNVSFSRLILAYAKHQHWLLALWSLGKSSYCEKNAPLAREKAMHFILYFFLYHRSYETFLYVHFVHLLFFFLLFRIIHNLSISILSPLVSIFLFPFLSHYSHGIDQGRLKINVHLRSLNARMRAAGAYDIPLNDISQLQIIEDLANVGVSSLVSVLQRALHRFLLFGPVLLIAREM